MHGKASVTQATTRSQGPYSGPQATGSGKQHGESPSGAQSGPAALSSPRAPCSVCGQHLTPPGASPQAPAPDSQTHRRKQTPATSSHETEGSLLYPGPHARRHSGADAPRASNLQPHLVISTESGHAHICAH